MSEFIPKPGNAGQPPVFDNKVKTKTAQDSSRTSFDQVLTNQLKKEVETRMQDTGFLPEIQSPVKIPSMVQQDTQPFVNQIEQTISLLEAYAGALENPSQSLKDAYGLLEQLMDQTRLLEESFEQSDTSDSDLSDIITHLVTTAAVEKLKFDRGDYTG